MLPSHAEAYSTESFRCERCEQDFDATVITWVDVSRTPQARTELLRREFNVVQCRHCGHRHVSDSPFFYEDFEDGLLVAVFPTIPENRSEIESKIRNQYAYYPQLEFFYDMAQLWLFVYLQRAQKGSRDPFDLARVDQSGENTHKCLRLIRDSALLADIRDNFVPPRLRASS